MANLESVYAFEQQKSEQGLKFFFISKGCQDIIKAVEYSFIQALFGRKVYNLGFGDYDIETGTITDDTNTNNGDAYKVLNTVLSTIPVFFENYNNDIVVVQGSDGRPEFVELCKKTCRKRCNGECKNFNRRISIYTKYVNKYFEELIIDYQFFGGLKGKKEQAVLESYVCGKKYDSVLLFKRNV